MSMYIDCASLMAIAHSGSVSIAFLSSVRVSVLRQLLLHTIYCVFDGISCASISILSLGYTRYSTLVCFNLYL
jgi:hypothetical protein